MNWIRQDVICQIPIQELLIKLLKQRESRVGMSYFIVRDFVAHDDISLKTCICA